MAKAKPCRICESPVRERIDRALASGQSVASLARAFTNLSRRQIRHHRQVCLIRNPKLVHALRAGDLTYDQFGELLEKAGRSEEESSEIVGKVRDHLDRGGASARRAS